MYKATDTDLHARVEELNAIDRIGQQLAEHLEVDSILDITRNEVSRGTRSQVGKFATLNVTPTFRTLFFKNRIINDLA